MKNLVTVLVPSSSSEEGTTKVAEVLSQISPHSIELNKTTKGYTWTIKLYFSDENRGSVVEELQNLDRQLRALFADSEKTNFSIST
ncbi:MAG: hypothetical protein QXT73_02340 [Candidatus Methanomethylicaceae archaeon]